MNEQYEVTAAAFIPRPSDNGYISFDSVECPNVSKEFRTRAGSIRRLESKNLRASKGSGFGFLDAALAVNRVAAVRSMTAELDAVSGCHVRFGQFCNDGKDLDIADRLAELTYLYVIVE